ncbi:hypothetical protein [Planococcus lenghuensis]|uniref:Uncharacterized protein n=1 Tax=Planococcus lenghuensis TaxID=2213202 RepID=A0A1Q2L5D0_9BACL|nr:hypothetical protein [Planococcus lenghuensis]AQQ55611.1 hypothetical protein B0X71_20780 [Planococcus lenghuensis]
MDFGSVLILGSIIFFAILLSVGPIMELKGKILFENQDKPPVLKGRYGMGVMWSGALLFVLSLVLRSVLPGDVVTPFVMAGYGLWIIGGIIAVARNEVLAFMVPENER